MERKLMASSLQLEWLGFEQLLVERLSSSDELLLLEVGRI